MERFQQRISEFKRKIMPQHELAPQREYARLMEENMELYLEMGNYDGSEKAKDKVAEESGDVIIRHLGLIDSVGRDAATIVDNKLNVMVKKYPADKIVALQRNGMDFPQAMAHQKSQYVAA